MGIMNCRIVMRDEKAFSLFPSSISFINKNIGE
jgi:hypothetical protein